jgi:predicted HTH domain antitoxin
MSLTIEVPDDVLSALPIPTGEREGRLRMEMACLMYRNGWISLGKAAELARVGSFLMGIELAVREIPMQYDDEMLQEDFAYARGK